MFNPIRNYLIGSQENAENVYEYTHYMCSMDVRFCKVW